MFTRIIIEKAFKKAYERHKKAGDDLTDVDVAVIMIIKQEQIPEQYKNHELSGNKKGIWCLHVRGDLLLLYTPDSNNKDLYFHELGTHHQLLKR